jgi:hypothetical protein
LRDAAGWARPRRTKLYGRRAEFLHLLQPCFEFHIRFHPFFTIFILFKKEE